MIDNFSSFSDSLNYPSRSLYSVSPNNDTELPMLPKALYIGNGGDVVVRCVDDTNDVVFANVPSGSIIRARVRYVRATGTTASSIVAHC
ncbi:MAG: hypothetical protein E2598_01315 [Sphingobium sp.]|nr:hypothetical protein [Sphingobium sp.]